LEKLERIQTENQDTLYINFDETNLPFNLASQYTINTKGANQVPLLNHSRDTETCTVALVVTSDGDFLLPLVTFKYKSTDTAKEEKRTYPNKNKK